MLRVFVDTSALFAGIWSAEGAARVVLRLGEAGAVRLVVSPLVLTEIERALQRKAPELLGRAALLLATCGAETVPDPASRETIDEMTEIVGHQGDAAILAAAVAGDVDYLVTHDAHHFLDNLALKQAVPFPIGTPGDFLERYRSSLNRRSSGGSVATD